MGDATLTAFDPLSAVVPRARHRSFQEWISALNELVQLASDICGTPISLVSLLTADKQRVLSSVGTDLRETRRQDAFCAYTVRQSGVLMIEDARLDERFRNNPLVTGEPHIRFYAGVTLRDAEDRVAGALCVIDRAPRVLDHRQQHALTVLGHQIELSFQVEAHRQKLEQLHRENEGLNAKLQETNSMFRAFMDHAPLLCYMKDASGRFILFNRNSAEQLNIREEAVLGKRDHELWPVELADEYQRHDREVLRRGGMMEIFERTAGSNGAYRYWKSYKFPVPAADGATMLGGMSIDFTQHLERERKLLRTADENVALSRNLESTRALLQAFLDNAPYQSFMKTPDGAFLAYNQVFADYFGITREEWIGRSSFDVYPRELAERFQAHDLEVLRSGQPSNHVNRHVDRFGVERTFNSNRFVLPDANGRSIIGGVSYDISKDVELEAERGKMLASARMAALGMMAGGVAHEINNPLAIIHMAASALLDELERDQPDRAELAQCATHVLQTAKRIQKIVHSMRSLSRDAARDKPSIHSVASLLEETMELCRQRFRNSNVALIVEPIDPEMHIACQPAQLGQVLLNLLSNAYDAVREHAASGWVEVQAVAKQGRVAVTVTDSGPGIPIELRSRIMDPFFTTKEVGKGTGLGLSISRTIVAEHGGTLEFCEDTEHTCFTFSLPLVQKGTAPCDSVKPAFL